MEHTSITITPNPFIVFFKPIALGVDNTRFADFITAVYQAYLIRYSEKDLPRCCAHCFCCEAITSDIVGLKDAIAELIIEQRAIYGFKQTDFIYIYIYIFHC
jgi:hypothetical protein